MYFEATVVFIEEIQTKNGVREKKVRKTYLVECDSVSVAEAKVNEWLKDSPFVFETIIAKQSKIVQERRSPKLIKPRTTLRHRTTPNNTVRH